MTKNKDGLILLKKPEGLTSFQALGVLKKKLNTKKVGHTGTLDKFASGLLVILTGKMTKFAPYITGMDKTYQATFSFGTTTATLDPEGDFLGEAPIPSLGLIKNVISDSFSGTISQIPPDFSAVHVNGQRAYKLKLKGEKVVIPPRDITINSFDILDWDGKNLKVEISCSKGTYIRSIARDLGLKTGSLAYVSKLNRSVVGPFNSDKSVLGADFSPLDLVSPFDLISNLGRQISFISYDGARDIKQGKKFNPEFITTTSPNFQNGDVALFTEDREFVAMINLISGQPSYLFVASQ
ncbi:MAG: tRNA pseudouridine(55) synthase TruB [Spirochaetaceae bacterium 4572_7]|nr:MAG: tRNA pseudouridine(55) synthase TruB [Spirochaetaceae bacterium 4572_7]